MRDMTQTNAPNPSQLENELARAKHRQKYRRTLRSTVSTLIVVAAIAVLLASIFFPVLQIYGSSMTPTVNEGEIVVVLKTKKLDTGDVTALWYGNKLLVKRVIATSGQWVNIDADGNVYVDGQLIDEPYVENRSLGECNIELPCQVPDGKYFVLGDHRDISQDSRNSVIGCIAADQIVGRLILRVWPFGEIAIIK